MPNTSWVLHGKNCIRLYAVQDILINPNQISMIEFNGMSYEFNDCVGIPYIKKSENIHGVILYHTDNSFKWEKQGVAKIPIQNPTSNIIRIKKDEYLASVRLMSIPFYKLWKRHDNSDYGIMSVPISIDIK